MHLKQSYFKNRSKFHIKTFGPLFAKYAKECEKCRKYLTAILIFNIPAAIAMASSPVQAINNVFILFRLVFTSEAVMIFIPEYFRDVIHSILLFITIPCFLLDLFMFLMYGLVPDSTVVTLIFATNPGETHAFFSYYLLNGIFLKRLLLFGIGCLVFNFLFGLLIKHKRSFLMVLLLSSFTLFTSRSSLQVISFIRLYRLFKTTVPTVQQYSKARKLLSNRPITFKTNSKRIPYFCFILGESHARNHMSLYGYNLTTTPNLQRRYNNDELFAFEDVICGYSGTLQSIQLMFTLLRQGEDEPWYTKMNLFEILKAAGYYSAWLSNQEIMEGRSLHPTRLFGQSCTTQMYVQGRLPNGVGLKPHDEVLLDLLDHMLKESRIPSFHLLHLFGCHFKYRDRYPKNFSRFSMIDEPEGLPDYMRKTQAEFDNSMLYSDSVIDSIIQRYEDKKAIVMFVSDHGEEVYDTKNGVHFGHDGWTRSNYMVEIPMLIWMSKSLREERPDLVERFNASLSKPFVSDDIIHVIMDILEMETPEFNPGYSVVNPHFDSNRVRLAFNKPYKRTPAGAVSVKKR